MDILDFSEPDILHGQNIDIEQRYLRRVYSWMCVGLASTAASAWLVAHSSVLSRLILHNRAVFVCLLIAQIVAVGTLSKYAETVRSRTAPLLFIAYAVLTGTTLSSVFEVYASTTIETAFVVTAVMFAGLAWYGTATSRDLSGIGTFMFMGLIGLVAASVVELFLPASGLRFLINFVGVIVFAGLTAHDAQRLRMLASATDSRPACDPVAGALVLYLDVLNLFLSLMDEGD